MRPEPRAGRFEIRDELARLEVRAAVERHVLDEVRESLLIVGLEERPALTARRSDDALLRTRILADEELQAVRQRAGADGSVERNGLLKVEGRIRSRRHLRRERRAQ